MNKEKEKLHEIISTLISYQMQYQTTDIRIKLSETRDGQHISITSDMYVEDENVIEHLRNSLSIERLDEVEEYYRGLMTLKNSEENTYLVGAMGDAVEIDYKSSKGFRIDLYRKN